MNDWWETLAATEDQVWHRLSRGVADRRAPARHPVLATVGQGAEARVVVLRGADRATGILRLHTDLASAKVSELRAEPRATLLIWEEAARLQIRLRVRVEVLTGPDVAADWARVPHPARGVYGASPAPGAPLANPHDASPGPDPARFAVLACHVHQIETLHLGKDLHRRARFADGQGVWLAP
jgi:hypothetical protein